MMRIRKQDGSVQAVADTHAVEVISSDGKLAIVVFRDHRGFVHILTPDDPAFKAYCHTNALIPATVHHHELLSSGRG